MHSTNRAAGRTGRTCNNRRLTHTKELKFLVLKFPLHLHTVGFNTPCRVYFYSSSIKLQREKMLWSDVKLLHDFSLPISNELWFIWLTRMEIKQKLLLARTGVNPLHNAVFPCHWRSSIHFSLGAPVVHTHVNGFMTPGSKHFIKNTTRW